MTLELIPNNDLVFKGPFNSVSTTTLKLSNSGNERLAYKIKTTAPKRYCVKPNSGFLEPHTNTSIQVMLQPQPAGGQQDDRTKHKFMVQWVAVPGNYADDVDTFWKQDSSKLMGVQDSKLKCVFADEQAAVVPTDSFTQRDSETVAGYADKMVNNQPQHSSRNEASGDDKSKQSLKQEIDRLKDENDSLKDKLKQQESTLRQRPAERVANPVIDRMNQPQKQGGAGAGIAVLGVHLSERIVLIAFLVALLFGFTLGYFLFSCGN